MKVLIAAEENAWGGMIHKLREQLPDMTFVASGGHQAESLRGFDALIPGMAKVDRTLLASADQLKLIQQVGAGLEGVDIAGAREQGIAVANVPTDASGNADSVAELSIWMMTGLARRVQEIPGIIASRQLGLPVGMGLKGKTAGLVGFGGIGKALAKRLAAFEMRTIGVKRSADPELAAAYGLEWLGGIERLPQLLNQSDFVILSLPHNAETDQIIDAAALAQMKPGSFLINVGRGGLTDKAALLDALTRGHLAGAGLDVYWQEPADPQDRLFSLNVIATPHIGGVTDISLAGNVAGVCENLRRLRDGEAILNRW